MIYGNYYGSYGGWNVLLWVLIAAVPVIFALVLLHKTK